MIVYLVKQTQASSGYFDMTIYVCSTRERAIEYCRELNKEYGKNRGRWFRTGILPSGKKIGKKA